MSSDGLFERIEKLLLSVLERLDKLESVITSKVGDPAYTVALEVAMFSVLPAHRAVKVAREVISILSRAQLDDPITRAIVEILLYRGDGVSISELTRRVKEMRGFASRRIVSERLKKLESKGVVELRRAGKSVRVYLKNEVTPVEKSD